MNDETEDMNSARVINSARFINYRPILVKAREGHSRSNASGDVTSTIHPGLQVASMNQEHTLQLQGKPTRFSGGRMSQLVAGQ